MASERLENEVNEIFKIIADKKNFVLSGGAGSGKTYSLVSIIKEIYYRNPKANIACITYTNAAAHEINNRVENENIKISTIHDFMWENISSFQEELKEILNEEIYKENSEFKNIKSDKLHPYEFTEGIRYKEYLKIQKGFISHDEVIILANKMFEKYAKLSRIINSKYDFIFIDEYQDTFPKIVEIFLDFLAKDNNKKKCIIGFFGDSMQSIYDSGIGDLKDYITQGKVVEVKKKQNRRNPIQIVNFCNKLRDDGIVQEAVRDENGELKEGSIKFLYGTMSIEDLQTTDYLKEWNFEDPKETKELFLTHNLIAAKSGYPTLMNIYDKDEVLKYIKNLNKYLKKNQIEINNNKTLKEVSEEYKITEKGCEDCLAKLLVDSINKDLYDFLKSMKYNDVKKIYFNKDNLIADKNEGSEETTVSSKRDKLINHLFKIESIKRLYENKKYHEFLKITSFKIQNNKDKKNVKEKIDKLSEMNEASIKEVIEFANDSNLCNKDDLITNFMKENSYLYMRVSKVKYREFINLYNYLQGNSPMSTQHKVKGEEYNNVLVILDNGRWNKYNFKYLLGEETKKNQKIRKRTLKLFYVCCTRAKKNLVVYCENPTSEMIEKAKEWFGEENCKKLKQS